MNTLPIHPANVPANWRAGTITARQLLEIVEALADKHGEKWADHLPCQLEGAPHEILLGVARALEREGERVTEGAQVWWQLHGSRRSDHRSET